MRICYYFFFVISAFAPQRTGPLKAGNRSQSGKQVKNIVTCPSCISNAAIQNKMFRSRLSQLHSANYVLTPCHLLFRYFCIVLSQQLTVSPTGLAYVQHNVVFKCRSRKKKIIIFENLKKCQKDCFIEDNPSIYCLFEYRIDSKRKLALMGLLYMQSLNHN